MSSRRSNPFGLEQIGRQIALAGVGEDHHHNLPLPEALGDLTRSGAIRARGNSYQQAFLACEATREGRSVFVGNRKHFIVDARVERLRNEARADSLDLVEARLAA